MNQTTDQSESVNFGAAAPSIFSKIFTFLIRYWQRYPLGVFSVLLILALTVIAIFAPFFAPFDPIEVHRKDSLAGPSSTYLLGTDSFGRDVLSRLIYGSRISLYVGVAPILISTIIGTIIGVLSAYLGGRMDALLQRFMDALMAIPALVIALTMVALLGASANNVIIAIAVVTMPQINRVVRGVTYQILSEPFIDAAISLGASNTRIVIQHVLPNIVAPVVVVGASLIGLAILAEAGLSFLGLGIPPPPPTWGNMLGGSNRDFFEVAPWLAIFPGLSITITVLGFNILGDTIRDLLDPRTRGSNERF